MTMAEGDLAVTELTFVREAEIEARPPPATMTGAHRLAAAEPAVDAVQHRADDPDRAAAGLAHPGAAEVSCSSTRCGAAPTATPAAKSCSTARSAPAGRSCTSARPISPTAPIRSRERWRVDLFFAGLAFGIAWLLWLNAPRRDLGAFYFFIVLPIGSFILLHGFPAIGLPVVDTVLWGGVLVTIVLATVGIVVSLPVGIVLALGRRSHMPAVRLVLDHLHRIRARRAADHRAVHGERDAAAVRAAAISSRTNCCAR